MKKIYLYLIVIILFVPISGVIAMSQTHSIEQQKEVTVYITKTGKKYHRDGCRYLSRSKIKTTKKKAVKSGFGACSICKP